MNAQSLLFEVPEVKNRCDSVASSAVLTTILTIALCGALFF